MSIFTTERRIGSLKKSAAKLRPKLLADLEQLTALQAKVASLAKVSGKKGQATRWQRRLTREEKRLGQLFDDFESLFGEPVQAKKRRK